MIISALILCKNEEETLEDCLKQLDFVDEIIVLDQSSTDDTVKIAKKYTNSVLKTSETAFDKNRNLLASQAKGQWLLYLDSDERLTPNLIKQIKKNINQDKYSAFYIPRKNYVLGKHLRHGGWWPDYSPRLFKKEDFVVWKGKIHETPQFKGRAFYLKEPLVHLTARNLNLMLNKSIKWAKIEADLAYESNHPKVNELKIIKAFSFDFFYRYFIKLGFLDGVVGLIESIYQGLHKAMVLTYLWELQNNSRENIKKLIDA